MKKDSKLKNDLLEMEARLKSRSKIEQVLKLYIAIGSIIAVVALSYFVLSFFEFELTSNQVKSLMIFASSVVISIASWAMLIYRKKVESQVTTWRMASQKLTGFVYLWSEFEAVAKDRLERDEVEFSKHSIRSVISSLHGCGYIDEKDVTFLDSAIQLRNSIVHHELGKDSATPTIVDRTSKELIDIIEKINSMK